MDINYEISLIKRIQEETLALLRELRNNGVVDNKEKVYDLTDLGKVLKVSRRTLFKWKSEERLSFVQAGKKLYVTQNELDRFLNISNKK